MKTKEKLFLILSLFCILPPIIGVNVNAQTEPFFALSSTKDHSQAYATINETKPKNMQIQHQVLQSSLSSNSSKFSRHVMCKGWDLSYNPVEPTTIFRPSDIKAVCLITVSINKTIEFRWYYRSNSSRAWVSCYNWSTNASRSTEYYYEGHLLIAGYWPGINYPRAYMVEVYLDGNFSFSDYFEVTNGGLNSPRMCGDIDASGRLIDVKSRFTIGVDTKVYHYLRFEKIAFFSEELRCCHNFTTVWIQPDGNVYKIHSGNFSDYKDTNVTWNYWNFGFIPDDYIIINSSTPIGNWKVEVHLDSYFNGTWTAYGPIATTSFVVGSTPVADWTFMVYLDADIDSQTDTEEAGIATFLNLAKVGSSPKVNVVVQMDRMSGKGGYGNWTDCKRFNVTQGLTPTPENATLDLGEVNMGDPNILRDFINWTIYYHPAKYYCLVLWDHGAGVMGLCLDYTPQPTDCLYLPELSQALSGLPAIMDVVFIDACSMGMAEVAYQIKDYANVLIAPEGLGYAPAPYNYYLSSLTINSSISPSIFAKEIVADYIAWCGSTPKIQEATMSAIDLTKITSLTAAIDDFSIKLKEKETPYHEQIGILRNLTEGYPGPYANQTGYYIDLYHFVQLTPQYVQDEKLQDAANQVMTALSIGKVMIIEANKAHQNSHGLAIFFPDRKDKYDGCKSVYEETTFARNTIWNEFVKYDLSGCVLTIQTPYPDILIKVDNESYTTDADGKICVFSLPNYHTINVTTPISTEPGSRGVFTQWNDSSTSNPRMRYVSGILTMQAQYKTQYRLIVNTNFGTTNPAVGEHWYDANKIVSINATGSNATSNQQYAFDHWSVDGTDESKGVNPITVKMDKPYEATAYYTRVAAWWEALLRPEIEITLGLASAMLAIVLARTLWIRNAKKRAAIKPSLEPTAMPIRTVALPGRISSGYADLDNLLYGGVPKNYAVILTSPSCDERDLIVKHFLETGAKNNEITFYVSIDPGEIKSFAEEFPSTFYIFICNLRADTIMKSMPNVFKLKGVENLTEIDITLTRAFQTLNVSPSDPKRACIEIISDVLLQHHAVQTRRWLTDLITEMMSRGFTTLAVMNPKMHPQEEVHAILDLFEGEINIFEKETAGLSEKFLKIKKMHGQKYLDSEMILRKEKLEA